MPLADSKPQMPIPPPKANTPHLTPNEVATLEQIAELAKTPIQSFTTELRFDTGSDLFRHLQSWPLKKQRWAFRGHASASWRLKTTIERIEDEYRDNFRSDAEEYILRTFKRRAHHYLSNLPKDDTDELEWLALMRHHGAPTRLLDWTRSPYVAAFFATAEARPNEPSAVWAIDIAAVRNEAIELLSSADSINVSPTKAFSFSEREIFNSVFMAQTLPAIVAPVQPFKTNERVTSQQSLFLCPNSTMFGFEFALKQVLSSDHDRMHEEYEKEFGPDQIATPERLFKLVIAPSARQEILRELHRMNITYATLFPGLDGFGRSLNTCLTMSDGIYFVDEDVDSQV